MSLKLIYNIAIRYVLIFLLLNNIAHANGLDSIKSYVKSIKSIAVEFSQSDSAGNIANGILIIDKPYKFRCNYYKPFPLLIVGNTNYVSVYDYDMRNMSRIKAHENIFYFLLVDEIDFSNQFEVISDVKKGGKHILKLNNKKLNKISEITFDQKTHNIELIKIFEENNIISLKFSKTNQITSVKKKLFIIQDPDVFGAPDRLEKKDLPKYYKIRK